jgi:superfamily II DNA or RNA helicase
MENKPESPTLRFAAGTLLLNTRPPPSTAHLWKWDKREAAHRTFALNYSEVTATLREQGPTYSVEVARWHSVHWHNPQLSQLRPDQEDAVETWLKTRKGVLVMPTGTGKTEVALHIIHRLAVTTLVIAPVRDLMYQWHQRILERLGYDAGIIGDNTFNKLPVSVTTYESACIHMKDFGNEFQLIIFDECHHLPGRVRSDAARMSMAPYRLGLTATPERSDGRDVALDQLIGPIVYTLPLDQASGVILADYDVFTYTVHLSSEERAKYDACSEVIRRYFADRHKTDPGFSVEDLHAAYTKDPEARRVIRAQHTKRSIEDSAREKLRVLEDIFRLHQGTPMLVFTQTNIMAREVSARFLIPCLLNHARKKERRDILTGFREGVYPAIVANRVLDEGVDIKEAKLAVILGGLASVRQAIQRLGRIIRKQGEQKAALYEIICEDTKEVTRSRVRRRTHAYARTRHLRSRR